ncbi:MAG: hypothetical protein FWE01_02185 [Firmicutes bacterium]|nr:hypothetical protein [Bacillota bacterium]
MRRTRLGFGGIVLCIGAMFIVAFLYSTAFSVSDVKVQAFESTEKHNQIFEKQESEGILPLNTNPPAGITIMRVYYSDNNKRGTPTLLTNARNQTAGHSGNIAENWATAPPAASYGDGFGSVVGVDGNFRITLMPGVSPWTTGGPNDWIYLEYMEPLVSDLHTPNWQSDIFNPVGGPADFWFTPPTEDNPNFNFGVHFRLIGVYRLNIWTQAGTDRFQNTYYIVVRNAKPGISYEYNEFDLVGRFTRFNSNNINIANNDLSDLVFRLSLVYNDLSMNISRDEVMFNQGPMLDNFRLIPLQGSGQNVLDRYYEINWATHTDGVGYYADMVTLSRRADVQILNGSYRLEGTARITGMTSVDNRGVRLRMSSVNNRFVEWDDGDGIMLVNVMAHINIVNPPSGGTPWWITLIILGSILGMLGIGWIAINHFIKKNAATNGIRLTKAQIQRAQIDEHNVELIRERIIEEQEIAEEQDFTLDMFEQLQRELKEEQTS